MHVARNAYIENYIILCFRVHILCGLLDGFYILIQMDVASYKEILGFLLQDIQNCHKYMRIIILIKTFLFIKTLGKL